MSRKLPNDGPPPGVINPRAQARRVVNAKTVRCEFDLTAMFICEGCGSHVDVKVSATIEPCATAVKVLSLLGVCCEVCGCAHALELKSSRSY